MLGRISQFTFTQYLVLLTEVIINVYASPVARIHGISGFMWHKSRSAVLLISTFVVNLRTCSYFYIYILRNARIPGRIVPGTGTDNPTHSTNNIRIDQILHCQA